MERRYYLIVAGAAILAAIVWMYSRNSESLGPPQRPSTPDVPLTAESDPGTANKLEQPLAAETRPRVEANVATPPQARQSVASAGSAALPIDVSPGFEFLAKPASEMKDTDFQWSNWRRHQQLQAESRDETWAPRMEAALRSGIEGSLMARGVDTQRVELPVVECRTTGCEIQAVGYQEDNLRAGVDLQSILLQLLSGGLGNEFDRDQYGITVSGRSDQRITFLALLPRKKP